MEEEYGRGQDSPNDSKRVVLVSQRLRSTMTSNDDHLVKGLSPNDLCTVLGLPLNLGDLALTTKNNN